MAAEGSIVVVVTSEDIYVRTYVHTYIVHPSSGLALNQTDRQTDRQTDTDCRREEAEKKERRKNRSYL